MITAAQHQGRPWQSRNALWGWWPMNEGSGSASASAVSANALTLTNAVWADGRFRKAISFDGVGDSCAFASGFDWQQGTAFSIAAWVKPEDMGATRCILSTRYPATYGGIELHLLDAGNIYCGLFNGAGSASRTSQSNSTVADSVWSHVVVTYDGSSSSGGYDFYINGAVSEKTSVQNTSPGTLNHSTQRLGVRNHATVLLYYKGLMDNLCIYSRELAAPEIAEMYQRSK